MQSLRTALVLLLALCAGGQQVLRAQWNLANGLSVRHAVFLHPESGPYLEVYLNIHGRALAYTEQESGRYQASAGVTIMLREVETETVVDYLKYRLESPEVRDTNAIDFALTDQQRLLLPRSELELEVLVEDLGRPGNTREYRASIWPNFEVYPAFSDIEFLDEYRRALDPGPFTKNGLHMVPYAEHFFPGERSQLKLYAELYGSEQLPDAQAGLLITASIRERGSEGINPNFWQYQKAAPAAVLPVLREFDITELPTGNYEAVLELRNRNNEVLISQRAFFQRYNPRAVSGLENIAMLDVSNTWAQRYSVEQLQAYLDFIRPIASRDEQNLLDAVTSSRDSLVKQRFLYNFWLQRDEIDAYQAWLKYLERVKLANDMYSTTSALGYRTDRGRVLLQYGEPNDIVARVNEPGAKPYEIWQYYKLDDGQTNIRFIFYEPTLVTNNYQLIHSNAIGEVQDQRWQMRVYGPTVNPSLLNNFDVFTPSPSFGNNAAILENDAGNGIFNQGRP
jgi:GWxTD domain-containing protein